MLYYYTTVVGLLHDVASRKNTKTKNKKQHPVHFDRVLLKALQRCYYWHGRCSRVLRHIIDLKVDKADCCAGLFVREARRFIFNWLRLSVVCRSKP